MARFSKNLLLGVAVEAMEFMIDPMDTLNT